MILFVTMVKKIDVKSACSEKGIKNGEKIWPFKINKNKIADYFLCLGFDNRQKLNPIHLWLIPGNLINKHSSLRISDNIFSKFSGWEKYELDITKVIEKCNFLKTIGFPQSLLEKEKQFEKYGLPKPL